MAQSPRSPKSPGTKFNYANEDPSFWEKLGTLGRKKKIKEGNYQVDVCFFFIPFMEIFLLACDDSRPSKQIHFPLKIIIETSFGCLLIVE